MKKISVLFLVVSLTVGFGVSAAEGSLTSYATGSGWQAFYSKLKRYGQDVRPERIPVNAIGVAACALLAEKGQYNPPKGNCAPFVLLFLEKNGMQRDTFQSSREVQFMLRRNLYLPSNIEVVQFWAARNPESVPVTKASPAPATTPVVAEPLEQRGLETILPPATQAEVNVLQTSVDELSMRIDTSDSHYTSLQEQIDGLGSKVTNAAKAADVASLQKQIYKLGKAGLTDNARQEVEEKVSGFQAAVDAQALLIDGLDTGMTEMGNTVTGNTVSLAKISPRLELVESRVSDWVWPLVSTLVVLMFVVFWSGRVRTKTEQDVSRLGVLNNQLDEIVGDAEEGQESGLVARMKGVESDAKANTKAVNEKFDRVAEVTRGMEDELIRVAEVAGSRDSEESGVVFDRFSVSEAELSALEVGQTINVNVRSNDDTKVWVLQVEKLSEREVQVHGVVRSRQSSKPIQPCHICNVANVINSASKTGRLRSMICLIESTAA